MATFYIDPTVSGTGTGTISDPFKSWTSVTWTAGDTYLQKRGTVYDGSVGRITISTTGTASAPITLGAYGSGPRPVLDGGRSRDLAIFATNHAYINVSDFEIRNYTQAGPYFGTSTDSSISRFITLNNLWIHDIGILAGLVVAGLWFWGSNVSILNCRIEEIEEDGIWGDGQNCTIKNTIIRNISNKQTGKGDCVQFGGQRCSGLLIEDCYFDHTNNNDKQILVLFGSTETGATFTIRNTIFYGFASGAGVVSIDCATSSTGGAIFEKNLVISNRGFRYANADTNGRNMVCQNNIFVAIGDGTTNPAASAFLSLSGKAYNNTIVGFYRGVEVTNGEVKNNVFLNIGDFDWNANVSGNIANNCWWNVGRHAPTQEGTGNLNVDPKMTTNWYPLVGSPLIEAGVFVGNNTDYDGNFKRNPPTIGAYEYQQPRTIVTNRGVR